MRKALLCGMFTVLLASSMGCSGLMAKGDMAVIIDENALTAVVQRELAASGVMTDAAAMQALGTNAGIFSSYASAKTVNAFEYLFSADKKLLVNGEYAERLDKANALAAETLARASRPDMAPELRRLFVIRECNTLKMIKDAKDGRRSE